MTARVHMISLCTSLCTCAALAGTALAQERVAGTVATLRLRVTNEEHAPVAESGVLTFDRQGLIAAVTVVALDANGRAVRAGAVRWTTSDEKIVTIYDTPTAPSVRVVAQEDGRAALTVTAGGKSATLPVVVGSARLQIAAAELAPQFRVSRLEILAEPGFAGPGAEATQGKLRLKENGHGALLKARAFAADGTPVPLEFFPVAWTSGDEKIVELVQTAAAQTQIVARAPGSTTLAASIQGVTATLSADVLAGVTELGPIERPQLVATSAGSLAIAKGEAVLTSTTLRTVDSTTRSGGILTTAPTTSTTTSTTTTTRTMQRAPTETVQATAAALATVITTPELRIEGRYMRTIVAPTLTIRGRHIENITLTTAPLSITGKAP